MCLFVLKIFATPAKFKRYLNCITFGARAFLQIDNLKIKMPGEDSFAPFSSRQKKAEELISFLKNEVDCIEACLSEKFVKEEIARLMKERENAKQELTKWKSIITKLEIERGIHQIPVRYNHSKTISTDEEPPKEEMAEKEDPVVKQSEKDEPKLKSTTKDKKKEKPPKPQPQSEDNLKVDVSRLDLRVGRIISVERHPDADSLYVEKIDLAEEKPRTVVSGLVKFVPLEAMQNRLVVVLCNLKPAKMRGILSEAMVMCASTPDKVEILCPPDGAVPGDRITSDNFPGVPDALLNPKKKIFEQVAPDLKTNEDCIATYKSSLLKVNSKGVVRCESLAGVQIK